MYIFWWIFETVAFCKLVTPMLMKKIHFDLNTSQKSWCCFNPFFQIEMKEMM
tara:strand:- start:3209 stop:3364 length:156 start_codon:yes stop_codon:yes gene_type:complete